jgi:hypothetical protein
VRNAGGTVTLEHSTLSGNTAPGRYIGSHGGGVRNAGGTVTLARTLVPGNTAACGPEILNDGSGTVTADNHNLFGHSGLTTAQAFFDFTPGGNDRTATSDGTVPTTLTAILNPTLANNGGPT